MAINQLSSGLGIGSSQLTASRSTPATHLHDRVGQWAAGGDGGDVQLLRRALKGSNRQRSLVQACMHAGQWEGCTPTVLNRM